jgi:hypothetical protein
MENCLIPRPDVRTIADRIKAQLSLKMLNGAPVLPGSNEDIIAGVMAGVYYEMYSVVDQQFSRVDPATACCADLYAQASRKGIFPANAKRAVGYVKLLGVPGTAIPNTLEFSGAGDRNYKYDTTLASNPTIINNLGEAIVRIRSLLAGTEQNFPGVQTLTTSTVVPGINTDVTLLAPGATGGSNIEGCEEFRTRYIEILRRGPITTNIAWVQSKFFSWPGVTRVCVVRGANNLLYDPDCAVSCSDSCLDDSFIVFPFFDDVYSECYGVPPATLIAEMNQWFFGSTIGGGEAIAPIGMRGLVKAPQRLIMDVTFTGVSGYAATVAGRLEAEIDATLRSICPGGVICKADIDSALSRILGTGNCYNDSSYGFRLPLPQTCENDGTSFVALALNEAPCGVPPSVDPACLNKVQLPCGYFPVLGTLTLVT